MLLIIDRDVKTYFFLVKNQRDDLLQNIDDGNQLKPEDYDFISRMISNNFKVSNINEFLVKYRVRKNSISISRAYEQYLSSERVIKYMKERRYGNDSYELEQEFYKNISDKERKKYFLATEAFIKSRERLNEKKYFLFFNEFLKSFFISRYRFKKNINIIIYNLKIKLHNMKNK